MNIESKADYGMHNPAHGTTESATAHTSNSSKDKLVADLGTLLADVKTLLADAAACPVEGYSELRSRIERKLVEARASIMRARTAVGDRTRRAGDATQAFVRENPWRTAVIAASAGLVAGFLLARR